MFLDGIFNRLSELKYAGSIDTWYKGNTENKDYDFLDEESTDDIPDKPVQEVKELIGECTLAIRIKNHGQYLMWQKLNGGGNRQWEFLVSYPAIMRGKYIFKTSLDVEIIAKKIVHLMQMGFDIYSANWRLKEQDGDDKIATETTP